MYYDKRQHRLNRFQGEGDEFQTLKRTHGSSSRRRKRAPDVRTVKFRKVEKVTGQLDEQRCAPLPDTMNQLMEEQDLSVHPLEKHGIQSQLPEGDGHLETEEEAQPNEDNGECYSVISRCALSKMKPTRQKRFTWTEEANR